MEEHLPIDPVLRFQLVEFFRSLDAALDEHKTKGTPAGHPSYQGIFGQLVGGDLALLGVGRDHVAAVAAECGHLSTYKRLEQLMTKQDQPQESAAINLLNDQLLKLPSVRVLDYRNPKFILWRDTTENYFKRFLPPDSPHLDTFRSIRFRGQVQTKPRPYSYRGPRPSLVAVNTADRELFERGCAIAEECINGAIDEIRNFGIHSERARNTAKPERSGVQQNFHGPVVIHNQAIATDNAIQNIGQIGNAGATLKEISTLLDQSMELTGRERLEGLRAIEVIASETRKPEPKRNWKTIVEWGEKLLTVADKATDMTIKLAPYLPALSTLIREAAARL